jgi:hypothetical protein
MKYFEYMSENHQKMPIRIKAGEDENGNIVHPGDTILYGRNYVSEVAKIYLAEDIFEYADNYNVAGDFHYRCSRFKLDYPNAKYAYSIRGIKWLLYSDAQVYKLQDDEYVSYDDAIKLDSYKKIINSRFINDITSDLMKRRGHFVFKWRLPKKKGYGGFRRIHSNFGRIFVRRNEVRRRDLDTISGHPILKNLSYPILTMKDYDQVFKSAYNYIFHSMEFEAEAEADLFKNKHQDWKNLKGLGVI